MEILIDSPDYEWLILMHPHGSGAVGGNQDMNRTKGGSTQSFIWP